MGIESIDGVHIPPEARRPEDRKVPEVTGVRKPEKPDRDEERRKRRGREQKKRGRVDIRV